MYVLPAIDLYGGKAVRLYKGDYAQMTVYGDDPAAIARDFQAQGAEWAHVVDLEGAKTGEPKHLETLRAIVNATNLKVEIGGGLRNMQTADEYFSVGVARVILGTAAVRDEAFLRAALKKYGEKIAVGADVVDGKIAVKGWIEKSEYDLHAFMRRMQDEGVRTVVCTDVSKDGAMQGANHALYRELKRDYGIDVVASGGVSTLADVEALKETGVYGAIVGKAYYTGAISLSRAIEVAR